VAGGFRSRSGLTDDQRGWMLAIVCVLLTPLFYMGSMLIIDAQPAGATSSCLYRTNWSGFLTNNYANHGVQGDLDYYSDDMYLYDDNMDHGAIWLGNNTPPNSEGNSWGYDWNQVGYAVGTGDDKTIDRTEVYSELAGPNTTGSVPTLTFFPDLSWGNHYFADWYTGETGDGGRGLYEGAYSLNDTDLGTSWMINPNDTRQQSSTEAYQGDPNGWCPEFQVTPLGTNGNVSNPAWGSTTEMLINYTQSLWEPWTPGSISTLDIPDSVYTMELLSQDDAWESYGGGP
jgi:hypothetical protein